MGLKDEPFLEQAPRANGVYLLSDPTPFEALFARVRAAEMRIRTDAELALIPDGTGLWNADEWRLRARGADRLLHALRPFTSGARLIEVGCGNGWLANKLHNAGFDVLGIDTSTEELEQAVRVFGDGPVFARADPFDVDLPAHGFDVVVFAASFHHFMDAARTIERAKTFLRPGGEIHILDSIFHPSTTEAEKAMERGRLHYTDLGFPEMAEHCHAHTLRSLQELGAHIRSTPSGMDRTLRRFGREASPFSHVVLHRQ